MCCSVDCWGEGQLKDGSLIFSQYLRLAEPEREGDVCLVKSDSDYMKSIHYV